MICKIFLGMLAWIILSGYIASLFGMYIKSIDKLWDKTYKRKEII